MLSVKPYPTPEGMKYGVYEDYKLISKLYPTERDAQLRLIKISIERKQQDPSPDLETKLEPERPLYRLDPSSPTILKLRCIASGIMTGQVTLDHITDKHMEVLISFESYYSKNGYLTEKQLKWCKSLLVQYNNIIAQLMKTGIKPVQFTTQSTAPTSTEDHRKYVRVVEFDEPKPKKVRGRIPKEGE